MSYKDDAIRQYYSLNPGQFGFLESLKLYREFCDSGCSDYILELKLRNYPGKKKEERLLNLTFTGVRNLKIGVLEGILNLLIDIRSVHEYQLEDLCYKIVENENEAFSFFCKDFKAVIS